MVVDPTHIHDRFLDHPTFCRESLTVRTEQGEKVPMELGPGQLRLREAIEKQQAAGKPVRIVYLKARRIQASAGASAEIFHNTPFLSGQHAAVIAHDEDTALNLFGYYKLFSETYKPFADVIRLPRQVKAQEGRLEWENGSWIQVATARNVNFGRSFNLRRVHFSEFAFYNNAPELMVSVLQAVPKDPDTMVIVESTANGIGNAFHKLCMRAMDPQNESDWIFVFFAWWEHPEYTMPLGMAADVFQNTVDKEEREMMQTYRLTLEQLKWRRWCIENNLDGDKAKFRQEYPASPEEAFIASGRLRYDVATISRQPVQRDALLGGLEIQTVGMNRLPIFLPRERGEFTLYRRPVVGRSYIIGADSAEGIDANQGKGESDPDYASAQVVDRDTGEQVATLRARLTPSAFGEYLYWIGLFYNWAGIVPEVNSSGIGVVDELLRLGYPPGLIYHRMKQPDEDPHERADNIGWKTTTVTRQQLLSVLDTALRDGSIIIHDPITIGELLTFIYWPNGKAQAQQGCHDDTVISIALAVVGILQMPRMKVQVPGQRPQLEVKRLGSGGEQETRGRRVRILN